VNNAQSAAVVALVGAAAAALYWAPLNDQLVIEAVQLPGALQSFISYSLSTTAEYTLVLSITADY